MIWKANEGEENMRDGRHFIELLEEIEEIQEEMCDLNLSVIEFLNIWSRNVTIGPHLRPMTLG